MALTYTTYTAALAELMVTQTTNADFIAILPDIIDYAELRIYRELNLLAVTVRDTSGFLTANSRNFTLPTSLGRFVVVQGVNVITPVGQTTTGGTRNSLTPVWRGFLDFLYPTETTSGSAPTTFAMITDQLIIVGPSPDAAYNVEVVGTIRPTTLSVGNTTTVLTTYLPDLFLAASMVFASGYQKNFGSQADDPKMAMSWEAQYEKLMSSADAEEMRKRYTDTITAR